jgi:hypothetical protein
MAGIAERVDRLERAIMELVYIQHKTEMEIQSLKKEMKEFKDAIQKDTENLKREFAEFKDEMKEFKDEMKEFKDEMKEFKDEMKEFKDWAKKTIEENHEWSKREIRRMNKQWGELANKMGTIVEDIVFPAVRPVVKKYFGCNPSVLMMNVEKRMSDINAEFDVIAVCDDLAFVVEVKSTVRVEYIKQVKNKVELFKELFPEYGNRKVVPILASLKIGEDILNKLTKEKIYGMAYREWEYMDILNFDVLKNG